MYPDQLVRKVNCQVRNGGIGLGQD